MPCRENAQYNDDTITPTYHCISKKLLIGTTLKSIPEISAACMQTSSSLGIRTTSNEIQVAKTEIDN